MSNVFHIIGSAGSTPCLIAVESYEGIVNGRLMLHIIGSPEVRHADQTLLFSTRKELALLIYLAVEGRIHLRKNLSEQFWPEGDARHGRAALRITVLHLRHLLGEGAGVDPVPHLLIQRDTLGLDLTSAVELDLHILNEAWTLARASTRTALTMPERRIAPCLPDSNARSASLVASSWRALAARCPGLRRLGAVPTRVLAPAHE